MNIKLINFKFELAQHWCIFTSLLVKHNLYMFMITKFDLLINRGVSISDLLCSVSWLSHASFPPMQPFLNCGRQSNPPSHEHTCACKSSLCTETHSDQCTPPLCLNLDLYEETRKELRPGVFDVLKITALVGLWDLVGWCSVFYWCDKWHVFYQKGLNWAGFQTWSCAPWHPTENTEKFGSNEEIIHANKTHKFMYSFSGLITLFTSACSLCT